jgi:hypothetical protein
MPEAKVGDTRSPQVRFATVLARRQSRPLLGLVGIPLAMIAALLAQPLCTVALVVCAWWWAPHDWGWEWLVAVGRGLIGLEWAYMGASALAAFADDRLVVSGVWVAAPAMLAAYAALRQTWLPP